MLKVFRVWATTWIRSYQTRSVMHAVPIRARGKLDFNREETEAKQGNYLIGCSLSSCFLWISLVWYLWLVVLRFPFLNLETFTGLGFGLLSRLLTCYNHLILLISCLIDLPYVFVNWRIRADYCGSWVGSYVVFLSMLMFQSQAFSQLVRKRLKVLKLKIKEKNSAEIPFLCMKYGLLEASRVAAFSC